ncbi:MAG: MoaD/ThiS family protein [Thermoplasmata archaeon]|nr:MoaD/ThiS family protein [Thermoplasmata archaeon]
MKVTVRYFAVHREATGVTDEVLDVPEGTSVTELMEELMRRHPDLVDLRRDTVISVNKGIGTGDIGLQDGDDVALFPPISGG